QKSNDVDRGALELLKSLGVELVEIALPKIQLDGLMLILFAECAASFEQLTLSNKDDLLGLQGVNDWPNTFRSSRFISAVNFVQADRLRRRLIDAVSTEVMSKVDAIVG